MHCGLVCLLASVLAVGVFAGAAPINKRAVEKLRLLCSIEQNRILDEIVENRSRLALEGLLLERVLPRCPQDKMDARLPGDEGASPPVARSVSIHAAFRHHHIAPGCHSVPLAHTHHAAPRFCAGGQSGKVKKKRKSRKIVMPTAKPRNLYDTPRWLSSCAVAVGASCPSPHILPGSGRSG
eukprot:6199403-Pleurochrysis_carterae.AAC.1